MVVLFLGGSGLVYEYCLSTLASHLLGNSIEQFSLIIALMLFSMGLAGLVQRHIPEGRYLSTAFIGVEILLSLLGGASVLLLYLAFAWMEHFRFVLYGLAMLIGFLVGLEIPLLLRINQGWREDLKENVGEILSLDYLGALLGALIWAFLLLPRLSLDRISLLLGLLNLLAAAATLWIFRRRLLKPRWLLLSLLGSLLTLMSLWFYGPHIVENARQYLYAHPILYHHKSPYQDIVITGRGGRMALYLNGHLQFDSEDEFIYHEMLVHPAMASLKQPATRALVLGGGDGLAVRELLRWPELKQVLLVDLDPAVTRLARSYPPLVKLNQGALLDKRLEFQLAEAKATGRQRDIYKRGERLRQRLREEGEVIAQVEIYNLDAGSFLRQVKARFPIIIVDLPDPSSPDLASLFSLEFYSQLRRHLSPGGLISLQSSSPYSNRSAFWAVKDTLEAAGLKVLSLHAHVPNFGEWGWHLAALEERPQPQATLPFQAAYATPEVIAAAAIFPPTLAHPGERQISTRLDPRVMQLYNRGEPLRGPSLF